MFMTKIQIEKKSVVFQIRTDRERKNERVLFFYTQCKNYFIDRNEIFNIHVPI